jgi:zinc transport system ATP-binding protein
MVLMTDSPAQTSLIELRKAAIGYQNRPAITDVDFTLNRGEVVAVVGPNGSGKTTLVRGILGLAEVISGDVRLFGRPARQFRERFRIGYVPQRHTVGAAVPSTVQEVVASGRLPRKPLWSRTTRADRSAVDRALRTVGLEDLRCCPLSILSGGQQRRTLIARALAAQPEILVMDEPTAGVDSTNQIALTRALGSLVGEGMTMVVITHEITPLLPILTRVVLVENARIGSDLPLAQALATGGIPGPALAPLDGAASPDRSGPPDAAPTGPLITVQRSG